MKLSFRLSAMVPVIALTGVFGCTSILQTLKITDDTPVESRGPAPVPAPEDKEKRAKETPSPPYAPPLPPDQEKMAKEGLDLRDKDEINESALQFAKNVPGVQHAKTCYSKLYGGWYLLLYVKKGQNISLQQYSWHEKSKEWEIIHQVKNLPKEDVERHLKIEVPSERCFRLK
ncbi:MAG: hypothetical protein FJ118_14255 [Deltaproteobacteria bacterium]|nr:hypothetical protein [Deltaproteobacteria bacterium]